MRAPIMPLWARRLVCRYRGHQLVDISVAVTCVRCDWYVSLNWARTTREVVMPKSAELSTREWLEEKRKIRVSNPWGRA